MKSNDDYDEETTKKAEKTAESYVKSNYQDVETVEIEKVHESPMGGMMVDGSVNSKYEFSIGMDEDDYTVQSIGVKHGFPDRKNKCEEKECDY
ncbi:MAG TPA: hypothetical protein VK105_18015 [Virgibacillus sp.]|nr:hypothetical protein [Virgibacillus sp.]HLR68984.1 hypothetical protein [Virgibacillus sp.]